MTSLQKLKEFGEGIGLKGEALATFIKEQQAEERAVRALEREQSDSCLLYTSPSPRDRTRSRMPSSA